MHRPDPRPPSAPAAALARVVCLSLLALAASPSAAAGRSDPAPASAARVRAALDRIHVHGVTRQIAEAEIAAPDLPALAAALRDPALRFRSNAVAFLAQLGGPGTAAALLGLLTDPPADPDRAEEYRALVLVPVMLGQRAGRGDGEAAAALLSLTLPPGDGRLGRAASHSREPARLQQDLLDSALNALVHAGSPAALARLEDVAAGRIAIAAGLRDPRHTARAALQSMTRPDHPPSALDADLAAAASLTRDPARVFDPAPRIDAHGWSWSNHVGATPVDDARVDLISGIASDRAGRADFAEDTACCTSFHRSGTAASFGVAGDGLDVIDNDAELWQVLGDGSGRVKVVRAINWCGGAAGFWGCAPLPGNSMVVIDGLPAYPYHEAALWVHEYGHNCGLGHSPDGRYFMVGGLDGDERALSDVECAAFHSPPPATGAEQSDVGPCVDGDGDEVRDELDNCPGTANPGQEDRDSDGRGDACDPCPDSGANTCPYLLRNADIRTADRAAIAAILVPGDPPLDSLRDLFAPDLTLTPTVRAAGDAGPVASGDPGVLIFYGVARDAGPLLAVRDALDVVLSGW